MLQELKEMVNRTMTENGAATYRSTQSDCLDLFATIGALRRSNEHEIVDRFIKAYSENADLAMKTLFYARDVRGGLGERNVARVILKWLAYHHKESVVKNLQWISEFGRYDDLLVLFGTPCEEEAITLIKEQLVLDEKCLMEDKNVSLMGKWLPSVNTSNHAVVKQGKYLAKKLGLSEKEYRKLLTALRRQIKIIENNLREKDYSFPYENQPSKAMYKYRKAFLRNDEKRYREFMIKVASGEAALHTGTLTPYDVIAPIVNWSATTISQQERMAMDITWNSLEDFTGDENALVVLDGSGSMYGYQKPDPASVAQSLAIYFAERNNGEFKDHFITFSENPKLVKIKGRDIYEKVQYCRGFDEVANTNLQRVFELILATAVHHKIPQREMPSALYIITDMEFDCCTKDASMTNFEYAKKIFAERGYQLPQVVFWNVESRNTQQPVEMNEQGVILVSGSSPRIFQMIANKKLSPFAFMMDVLGSPRYNQIVA